jgi:hypothetical protein
MSQSRILAIAIGMTAFLGLAAASAKETLTDDQIMEMAALEWAGMNCGTLIPYEDYWKAILFMQQKVDQKKVNWYRKRIRALLSKAATHEVACKSVYEALGYSNAD